MKQKIIIILTTVALLISTFVGCRNMGTNASGNNLNSTVSEMVSKVESNGKALQSQVSEAVSAVISG